MIRKILLSLALVASPAFAETVTIQTYQGPTEVPANPETIAVYDISALDTLEALGVKAEGVIQNVFVSYLRDAQEGTAQIGNIFDPDYEAVAALAPDLIIAGGRTQKVVPKLGKIAPTVDMTIWEDTIGQGLSNLTAFGVLFDKEAEAKALHDAFTAKLAATKAMLADKGKALVIMTNGPKVSAYGASGRFAWLYKGLGLAEVVENVEKTTHGEAISFEFIREADPDILIVVDRLSAIGQDGARAMATLDNALVHETKAWKNGKVIFLDSGPFYIASGGIQSLNITLDQINAAFAEN